MTFNGELVIGFCLCRKSVSSENVVCDFDLETHDLDNVISVTWT